MVLIAVAGGTGTAGKAVVAEALARGFQVRSLSRHKPPAESRVLGAEYRQADFSTGRGVDDALEDVDALVEALDARSGSALRWLPVTTIALLDAAARAGVKRSVLLTIAGARASTMGYYQVQSARALSYESAGERAAVVYATQFHDLVAGIFAAGSHIRALPVLKGVSFQPISTRDVARVLVDQAVSGGGHERVTAGGPEVLSMRELAEQWRSVTGSRAAIVPVPLAGSFARFLRAGGNLVPNAAVGVETFRAWLERR